MTDVTAHFNNSCYTFSVLTDKDISDAAELYSGVAITRENCSERLSPNSKTSFGNKGGMFAVQNSESLRKLVSEGESFLVMKMPSGKIGALMWVASRTGALPETDRIGWTDPALRDRVLHERDTGTLVGGGEIIVESSDFPFASSVLFRLMLGEVAKKGFTGHFGEVYRVLSYRCDGVSTDGLSLFNRRSFSRLIKTGAVFAGELPEKVLCGGGLEVTVRPSVVYWRIGETIDYLDKYLSSSGVKISSDGKDCVK